MDEHLQRPRNACPLSFDADPPRADDPDTSILQPQVTLEVAAPDFIVDLSGEPEPLTVTLGSTMVVHGTYSLSLPRRYVFGFHHLHAFLGGDGTVHCQDRANTRRRIRRRWLDKVDPKYVIPDISRSPRGLEVSFDRLTAGRFTRLDGYTFFGSPIEPANWGMWLLHGLLSAYSYVSIGQPGKYLCYAPEAWQQGLLAFIGVRPDRIVNQKPWHTYFCAEFNAHQYTKIDLAVDVMARALFETILARCQSQASVTPSEKIFVSRLSATQSNPNQLYRSLVNEREILAAFQERGYRIIEPEKMSFCEQVLTFRNARLVAGLGGAGMFNAVFCRPGTSVISIEGTSAFANKHARLFASLRHRYGFIFGREDKSGGQAPHNPWYIDVKQLMRAVDANT